MSKVRALHLKEQNSNHMLLKVKKQWIEELKKVTRSRQPPLLGASTCLSFFRTISNSLFLCISIKHLITSFKSAMLFTIAMALTISFTPDTFCVAKQTWNYICLILQKKNEKQYPFHAATELRFLHYSRSLFQLTWDLHVHPLSCRCQSFHLSIKNRFRLCSLHIQFLHIVTR